MPFWQAFEALNPPYKGRNPRRKKSMFPAARAYDEGMVRKSVKRFSETTMPQTKVRGDLAGKRVVCRISGPK
jgi:hypothetical protein